MRYASTLSRDNRCRPRQRRGTIYVAVLGVAVILTIIGMMSVSLIRINRRAATAGFDLTEATLLAQSAIEQSMAKLTDAPAWRTAYTHDTWEVPITCGAGLFQWKLVANSGDLASPSNGAVKIVGRGTVNDAVQEFSVYIENGSPGADIVPATWTIE
ncbi:MAG: hypothetical protein H8E66_01780 [Planctomycetes bacterium]|nr:hypothetical protein [Planctomycetota bacterium]